MGLRALTLTIGLTLAGAVGAQTAFAPVAIVNDSPITYFDVEQRATILRLGGGPGGAELQGAALEQLIDDRLRVQAGAALEIDASGEEIAAAATELAQRQGLDRAGLVERIQRAGATEDALIDLLRAQVVWREVVNSRFLSRATPTEVELDQEIALAASGETRSFRLSEIAVPAPPGREATAKRQVETALRELQAGGAFATVARRYSRAPSAANGGDVGFIPETALPPNIADALSAIQPGQITGILEVPGGFSLFQLTDVRVERGGLEQDAQLSLVRVMVPLDQNADDDEVAAARAQARELGENSEACIGQGVVTSDAVMERIPKSPLVQLPNSVQDAVRLLGPQQASRPVRSDGSMDVFIVCDREGGVDGEARDRLRIQIRNTRLARLAEGYMQELRREAVIERR